MRVPIIPVLVAVILLGAALYVITSTGTVRPVLDAPRLTRLADINGIETEAAIASDGDRLAVIVSGDLWLVTLSTGEQKRITETPQPEFFPNWTPDSRRITFSRGPDTMVFNPETNSEALFIANANWLSWSPTGRVAFVRERALWLAEPNGRNEMQIVAANENPDISIRTPRFAPDSMDLAFVRSILDLRGEIWIVNITNGAERPIVVDRPAENPADMGWVMGGTHLVYLTNRAGAWSLWHIDFLESKILPLTQVLTTMPMERLGISVHQDRIVLPRHALDSNIVLSDGTAAAQTEDIEFEPSVSPDGKQIAYTISKENDRQVWTAGIDGSNPTFRAVGHEPRWSPNGFEIVYTHANLAGNEDIWKIDIRNAHTERITDADEIDSSPDWSPDGRTIAFSSARGGPVSVWTIPASGGKRLRINEAGYGPRYSPDARNILYWNNASLWTMDAQGGNPRLVAEELRYPLTGGWRGTEPAFVMDGAIRTRNEVAFSIPGRPLLPRFDVLPDGRWVAAAINVYETGLWAVDLTFKEN